MSRVPVSATPVSAIAVSVLAPLSIGAPVSGPVPVSTFVSSAPSEGVSTRSASLRPVSLRPASLTTVSKSSPVAAQALRSSEAKTRGAERKRIHPSYPRLGRGEQQGNARQTTYMPPYSR